MRSLNILNVLDIRQSPVWLMSHRQTAGLRTNKMAKILIITASWTDKSLIAPGMLFYPSKCRGILNSVLRCVVAIALLSSSLQAHSEESPWSKIDVHVERAGATFTVEADWSVAAGADDVWGVLADFDHMAQILSSVDASHIVNRDGNRFDVEQTSHGDIGLVRISRDSVRRVELIPKREIRSHLLKGDLESSDFTTRIAEDGGVARISVRGKFVASGLAGSVITVDAVQTQTQRTAWELREEILRRKSRQPPPPLVPAQ